jgi:methyl-accepting chemotaxis protein
MMGQATSRAVLSRASGPGPSTAFRLDYALRLGLALVVGASLSVITVYLLLASELGSYEQSFLVVSSVRRLTLGAAVASGLVQLVVAGLLVAAIALVASHKLAGPTIRLERMLETMAEGRLPGALRFRSGDQTGLLGASFNQLAQTLEERHAHLGHDLEALRAAYASVEHALGNPGGPEVGGSVQDLCSRAEALARELERFGAEVGGGPDAGEIGPGVSAEGGSTGEPC